MIATVVLVGLFGGGSPGPPGILFHPNPFFFSADFFLHHAANRQPEEITHSGDRTKTKNPALKIAYQLAYQLSHRPGLSI